jgi:hypothetical protein
MIGLDSSDTSVVELHLKDDPAFATVVVQQRMKEIQLFVVNRFNVEV